MKRAIRAGTGLRNDMMGLHEGLILQDHIPELYYRIMSRNYITAVHYGILTQDSITKTYYRMILQSYIM